MKNLLFLSGLMVMATQSLYSQNNPCVSRLDSNDVIRLAKKKNVYWTKNWQCPPRLQFNGSSCEWRVTSCKISHTNKGECKYTNGCTVITTATLVINATTRKVTHLEKKKSVTRNYE